jgi:hypothetical protein
MPTSLVWGCRWLTLVSVASAAADARGSADADVLDSPFAVVPDLVEAMIRKD